MKDYKEIHIFDNNWNKLENRKDKMKWKKIALFE